MSDRVLQLRVRDGFPMSGTERRQDVEVLSDGLVLGRLPGVVRVDYEMAMNGLSRVTLDVIVGEMELRSK